MNASDVMTTPVLTVRPETAVAEIARLLLERRISAVPVVDAHGALVGIVSEGDLLRRAETGTADGGSWWLRLLGSPEDQAREYVKTHGRRAADVMTRRVITVEEDTPLREVAALLERHRIKRVPVVRGGQVVGIVSRANLLQALAAWQPSPAPSADDRALRGRVMAALGEAGVDTVFLNVVVRDGIVRLWGAVRSEEEKRAARVAAESVPGVIGVEDETSVLPALASGGGGWE